MTTTSQNGAIGVFDSGVGGLTVLKALEAALPGENFVYLGDTARLPYGTKSPETVAQYARQAAERLMEEDIKLFVVACNTASALALPALKKMMPHLPCLGVIEPGAEAAAAASRSGRIAVLATESTVRSSAYKAAVHAVRPDAQVHQLACNLMVALAEEGWCDGAEADAIVGRYLQELGSAHDTLVLGCTHFPLLKPSLQKLAGDRVNIIDSATAVAAKVAAFLDENGLRSTTAHKGTSRFLVTDSPERFTRLARRFLDRDIAGSISPVYLAPQQSRGWGLEARG